MGENEGVLIALERHRRQDHGEEEIYMRYFGSSTARLDSYDDL